MKQDVGKKEMQTAQVENAQNSSELSFSPREKLILGFICVVIVVVGVGAGFAISTMKKKPKKAERAAQVQVVETMQVSKQDKQIHVPAMGTVIPAVDVNIVPEVSGNIIEVSPNFVPGGRFEKGEVLLKINPKDYEFDLIKKQAVLEKAKSALQLEQGNQDIAKREWEILGSGDVSSQLDKELALRKPQLMEKIANMNSAKADVGLAKINLERTEIKAPFNAIIKSTSVNVGKQVSTQTQIAQLVGTDAYWVQVSLPVNSLKYIDINNRLKQGEVRAQVKANSGVIVDGYVRKLLSDVDADGKMARMIIEVSDVFPNANNSDGFSAAPLLLDDYVDVIIEGINVSNIFAIPRAALRDGDAVYLMSTDNKLKITQPEIIWRGAKEVYIKGGEDNSEVIVSNIPAPVDGMNIRKISELHGKRGDKAPTDKIGSK